MVTSRRTERHRAAATALALPWAGWAALRLTGTERGFPLVPAMSFSPHAAVAAVVPFLVALRGRSPAGAVLSAAGGVALAAAVRTDRRAPRVASGTGSRLCVATVSLRRGLVRAAPVLDLVRRHDVDVLAVQELTPAAERRLRAAGIDALLPHSVVLPARPGSPVGASGAVWSRHPVTTRDAIPGGFEQPVVLLDGGRAGTADVEVASVHVWPPSVSPAWVRQWASDLAAMPAPGGDALRVLAGDFNASADHAALRRVLRLGYVDAAQAVGRGATWTWAPLRLRFPRLVIDHVLIDPRIAVAAVTLVPVRGSDHRSVVAELVVPSR